MGDVRVVLLETIAEPPLGDGEPGFIVLAGTYGTLRRVRADGHAIVADHVAGREGVLIYHPPHRSGLAEVDFDEYLEWTTSSGPGDEAPRYEEKTGGWTVLNVPLEVLGRGGCR